MSYDKLNLSSEDMHNLKYLLDNACSDGCLLHFKRRDDEYKTLDLNIVQPVDEHVVENRNYALRNDRLYERVSTHHLQPIYTHITLKSVINPNPINYSLELDASFNSAIEKLENNNEKK